MTKVVLPLLGAGLEPEAVFVQLRSMYGADVNDGEIRNLIAWAITNNPQPCGVCLKARNYGATNFYLATPERVTPEQRLPMSKNGWAISAARNTTYGSARRGGRLKTGALMRYHFWPLFTTKMISSTS